MAHLSHASRQPQGTASNVTGLPHLHCVTSACSILTTAVAITRGTGGQNRVVAALPPVLRLSYASPRSMGSRLSSDRAQSAAVRADAGFPLQGGVFTVARGT